MKRRFIVGEGEPTRRVDQALVRLLPDSSRATIKRWILLGRVLKNGEACRPKDKVGPGDRIDVEPSPPPLSQAAPDPAVDFEVIFEDADVIVVNKPAGLVVHPARGHPGKTLVNGLLARPGFQRPPSDPRDPEGYLRPGVVHRIDKDTSGLLVIAKNEVSRESLKRQLSEHRVERSYAALTLGVPRAGRIETGYGRHARSRLKYTSKVESPRRAITQLDVIEVFPRRRAALCECRLETGRTHQIRVHLSEQLGTPLLADSLYGKKPEDPEVLAIANVLGRQALHAQSLGFTHPRTAQRVRFEVPLPHDMRVALESLRGLT